MPGGKEPQIRTQKTILAGRSGGGRLISSGAVRNVCTWDQCTTMIKYSPATSSGAADRLQSSQCGHTIEGEEGHVEAGEEGHVEAEGQGIRASPSPRREGCSGPYSIDLCGDDDDDDDDDGTTDELDGESEPDTDAHDAHDAHCTAGHANKASSAFCVRQGCEKPVGVQHGRRRRHAARPPAAAAHVRPVQYLTPA